jgi:CHAD domain-containing protein
MAQEIERRFLLEAEPQWLAGRRLVSVGGGLEARIEVHEGDLDPILATVAFPSERESREFVPPGWLGREVTGESPKGKATAYRFKRRERIDDGIRRIAAGRAGHALGELAGARADAGLAEAIHTARKDTKKLRAVLRLVRGPLGKKAFRAENHRYRDAARLLSRSRDAEVKLETLAALRERFGTELPAEPTRAWGAALEAERDEAVGAGEGEAGERIGQARALIEAGRERIRAWPLDGDGWELIGPGLVRGYRQGRRQMKLTRKDPDPEQVHRWRKRVKDLWYQLRLVHKAAPQPLGETAERAHKLADLLGEHHDLALLAEDLCGRDGLAQREHLAALIERRQGELLEVALGIGERLFAEKPKAFGARIEGHWVAWRE